MPVLPEVGSMRVAPGFRTPRASASSGLRVLDHRLGDAVLHGPGGVEVFQLGDDLCLQAQLFLQMGQFQIDDTAIDKDGRVAAGIYSVNHDILK